MSEQGYQLSGGFVNKITDGLRKTFEGSQTNPSLSRSVPYEEFYVRLTELITDDASNTDGKPIAYKGKKVLRDLTSNDWEDTNPTFTFDPDMSDSHDNSSLPIHEVNGAICAVGEVHKVSLNYFKDNEGGRPYWGFSINPAGLSVELISDQGGGLYTGTILDSDGLATDVDVDVTDLSGREKLLGEKVLIERVQKADGSFKYQFRWDDPRHIMGDALESESIPDGANGEFDSFVEAGGTTLAITRNFDPVDGEYKHRRLVAINDSDATEVSVKAGLKITQIDAYNSKIELLDDGSEDYREEDEEEDDDYPITPTERRRRPWNPYNPPEDDDENTHFRATLSIVDPIDANATRDTVIAQITAPPGSIFTPIAGSPISIDANGFIRATAPTPGATIIIAVNVKPNVGHAGRNLHGQAIIGTNSECPIDDESNDQSTNTCESYVITNTTLGEELEPSRGQSIGDREILSSVDLDNTNVYVLPSTAYDINGNLKVGSYTDTVIGGAGDTITVACGSTNTPSVDDPCCESGGVPTIEFDGIVPRQGDEQSMCYVEATVDIKWGRRQVGLPSVVTWDHQVQETLRSEVKPCVGADIVFDHVPARDLIGRAHPYARMNIINGGREARVDFHITNNRKVVAKSNEEHPGEDFSWRSNLSVNDIQGTVSCRLVTNDDPTEAESLIVGTFEFGITDCSGDNFTTTIVGGADSGLFNINGNTIYLNQGQETRDTPPYELIVKVVSETCPGLVIPHRRLILSHTITPTVNVIGNQ